MFVLVFAFVVAFGIWYAIFWFILNESDPFNWHWAAKIIYLLLASSTVNSVIENIEKQ